jgi:putative two-component system hydrogenase maturation factor HypX/HoxX
MGGLYGSEYWTYLLPRRVGADAAIRLTSDCKPLGTKEALRIGLIDAVLGDDARELRTRVRAEAEAMAADANHGLLLEEKRRQRALDEQAKPLSAYRQEELARMHDNFYGADRSYHVARRRFVRKLSSAPRSASSSAQPK